MTAILSIAFSTLNPRSFSRPIASTRSTHFITSASSCGEPLRSLHVGFDADTNAGTRPQVREIVFGDTPDFRLYNHSFILRRRIRYQDGFPIGDPEIVLKFRHPDEETAAAIDVRPKIAGTYRMKFKVEALPLKDEVGGFRFLYSHNCVFGLSQMHDADKLSMQTLNPRLPCTLRAEEIERRSGSLS